MKNLTKKAMAIILALCLLIPSFAIQGINLLANTVEESCVPVRFDSRALAKYWKQTVGINTYKALSEVVADPNAGLQIGQDVKELSNGGTSIRLGYKGNANEYTSAVVSIPDVDLSKTPYLYLEDGNFNGSLYYELYVGWEGATPFGASDQYKQLLGVHYHAIPTQPEAHKFDLRTQLTDYESKKGATLWVTVKVCITETTTATVDYNYLFLGVENATLPTEVIPVRFDDDALANNWKQTVGMNTYKPLSEVVADPNAALQIGQNVKELNNGGTSIRLGYKGNANDYTFAVVSIPNVDLSKTPYLYLEDGNFNGSIYYELYVGWEGATPFGASDQYKSLLSVHYHAIPTQPEAHKFDLRTQLTDYESKKGATLWVTVKVCITETTTATVDYNYLFLSGEKTVLPTEIAKEAYAPVRFDDDALADNWKQTVGMNTYKALNEVAADPNAGLQIGQSVKELSNGGTSIRLGYKGNANDYTFAVASVSNVDLSKTPYLYLKDSNYSGSIYYELYVGWEGATPFGASDQYKQLLGIHYSAEAHEFDLRTQLTDYGSHKGSTLWITVKVCITQTTTATFDFDYLFLGEENATMPKIVEKPVDPSINDTVGFAARMDATALANNWKQTVGYNTYKALSEVAADPTSALQVSRIYDELDNGGTPIRLGYKGNANDYTFAVLSVPNVDLSVTPYLYLKDSNYSGSIYYELYVGWEGATLFGASDQYKQLLGIHYSAEAHKFDLRTQLTDYESHKGSTLWITVKVCITDTTTASFDFDYLYIGGKKATAPTLIPATGHAVTAGQMTNGTVTLSTAMADEEDTVTVTVTPAEGYVLKIGSLKYNGKPLTNRVNRGTSESVSNEFYFLMGSEAVTVTAEFISADDANIAVLGASVGAPGTDAEGAMRFGSRVARTMGSKGLTACGTYIMRKDGALGATLTEGTALTGDQIADLIAKENGVNTIRKVATTVLNDRCDEYVEYCLRLNNAASFAEVNYVVVAYAVYGDVTVYSTPVVRNYSALIA